MCLTTTQRKPKVATRNIKVYKVVLLGFNFFNTAGILKICSPYFQGFKWQINEGYKTKLGTPSTAGDVGRGLHATTSKEQAKRVVRHNGNAILEGVIPKGSEYFTGKWESNPGHIVANQMMLKPKVVGTSPYSIMTLKRAREIVMKHTPKTKRNGQSSNRRRNGKDH